MANRDPKRKTSLGDLFLQSKGRGSTITSDNMIPGKCRAKVPPSHICCTLINQLHELNIVNTVNGKAISFKLLMYLVTKNQEY